MSGGKFNCCGYTYYSVHDFAVELENEIKMNNTPNDYGYCPNFNKKTINCLSQYISQIKKISEIMQAIDYLYSGDHGEDSFLEKIEEIEKSKQ